MKPVKSCRLIETQKQNRYFYDQEKNKTHLCHPLLYHIVQLDNGGTDIGQWFRNLDPGPLQIEGVGSFSREEVDYYRRKYVLLKENGYFSHDVGQEERLSARLHEKTVKSLLANSRNLNFEVTERCNLNCKYCGYGEFYCWYDEREKKDLEVERAKRFLDYLVELWESPLNRSQDNYTCISFYGGEPLVNFPFVEEIVRYVKESKPMRNRFIFNMTTNGVLLDKYMDFLHEHNFLLLISLDGNEANNTYRRFKNGKPAYSTILKNIKALQARYPEYFRRRVEFNAVLHNKNSIADIHRFFRDHLGKDPTIGELATYGINDSQKEKFRETYSNAFESLYQSEDYATIEKEMFVLAPTVESVSLFVHHRNDFCFNDYHQLMYRGCGNNRVPTGTCTPFYRKIFMTVNGKILPCERVGHQFYLGTVTPDRVDLDFKQVADKYNAYFDKMSRKCKSCYNSEACIQCMYHLDLDNENPVCKGYMAEKDFSKYMSSFVSYIEKNPDTYSKILKEVVIG